MNQVHTLPVGLVESNCHIIVNENKEALIVDPGAESEKIIRWVTQNEWQPRAILLTHAHFDHIEAVDDIRDTFNIKVYLHELEKDFLMDPLLNLSTLMPNNSVHIKPADKLWNSTDMTNTTLEGFNFSMAHVPGHSPGSVIYIFENDKFIIGGDTLFQGSIGRTDFPGGSHEALINGIRQHILIHDDDFRLFPGHGPVTTVGHERISNPFLT